MIKGFNCVVLRALLPVLVSTSQIEVSAEQVSTPGNLANTEKYYASFYGGKNLPFTPQDPITAEQATTLDTYLKAGFDSKGRMIELTRFLYKDVFWTQTIKYREDGTAEVVVDSADRTRSWTYDEVLEDF